MDNQTEGSLKMAEIAIPCIKEYYVSVPGELIEQLGLLWMKGRLHGYKYQEIMLFR